MLAAATSHGIFDSDTLGLLFTFGILLPALATGLVVVAIVSGRGEKQIDEQIRGRRGRRRSPTDS
jgi:hypothetical protein